MARSTLLLSVALIALACLPPATSPEAPELRLFPLTELKAVSGGHFVTRAEINGRDVDVMVDTGATAVALSYEDAQAVGLRPSSLDYTVMVSTANGIAKAAPVTLDKVEIDGVRVRDVNGLVMPEGAMRGSLLGMSFLGRLQSFRVEDGVLYLKN
jgi:aspartyl protease family protein